MPRPIRSPIRETFAAVLLLTLAASLLGTRPISALLVGALAAVLVLPRAARVLRQRRSARGAPTRLPPA